MAMKALEYLQGIAPEDCQRLQARGIRQTNQLLHLVTLDIDRQRLSARTGISKDRLLELGNQCALLEISGLEHHVAALRRIGITSLQDLKQCQPVALQAQLIELGGLLAAPSLGSVEYWISQARTCDTIELPSKT
jgi:Domain of unknown function (DUF4332)